MSDISVPHSLNEAKATLNLADSFAKILDPNERKKIADDIVKFHALNDTEAKKAEDARNLIKQNADILAETQKTASQLAADKKELEQNKLTFATETATERNKIKDEWAKVKTASDAAKDLHDKANGMINDVTARESSLRADKEAHADNVKKLAAEQESLKSDRAKLDKYREEVLALDNETKAKVEKLKQFNF